MLISANLAGKLGAHIYMADCKVDEVCHEKIVFEHSASREMMLDALDYCKSYIQQHDLMLVGGMAIDLALRSIGQQLYADNSLPDYDFYSPTFHIDAYAIAEELAKKYDGVNAINAFHTSTMRVRIHSGEVADITYVPPKVLATIPFITFQGLRIVHPHYQMIDQHRALSMPFENPPLETVFSRWKKDVERFDIIRTAFPVSSNELLCRSGSKCTGGTKPEAAPVITATRRIVVTYEILSSQCLSGYASLLFWFSQAATDGYDMPSDAPKWLLSYDRGIDGITVELPTDVLFSILSDDFREVLVRAKPQDITYYRPLLDKLQQRVVSTLQFGAPTDKKQTAPNFEIFDNRGSMRSAFFPRGTTNMVDKCSEASAAADVNVDGGVGVQPVAAGFALGSEELQAPYAVSNLQEVLGYLLTQGILRCDRRALEIYVLTLDLLLWAAAGYREPGDKFAKYLPTVTTFGKYNVYEGRILSRTNLDVNIYGATRTLFTPRRAYLDRGGKVKASARDFKPESSPLFLFDGTKTEPFEPREI